MEGDIPMRSTRSIAAALVASVVVITATVAVALASPAQDVTPLLLARGTYPAFKVASYPDNGGLFKMEAKEPIDVVVRQHTYLAGGSTGWHAHPYPVLITVKEGTLTFYDADDPTCQPLVLSAGQGYVDSGRGHLVRNETGATAVDVSVIMAPVGAPFRTELVAPNPNCGF
jgi:quercetin dioxygenase-like cupin family protein